MVFWLRSLVATHLLAGPAMGLQARQPAACRRVHRRAQAFIDEARRGGGAVLVHCVAGRSRSATVCCAYLMHQASAPLSVAHALHHLRECRPWVEPNSAFQAQLEQFALHWLANLCSC